MESRVSSRGRRCAYSPGNSLDGIFYEKEAQEIFGDKRSAAAGALGRRKPSASAGDPRQAAEAAET